MCDRVELSLHIWLENSFSTEPQKWGSCSGLSGETIVCEDGIKHSTSLCLLTSMSDCFRCSFPYRDDCSNRENLFRLCWNDPVCLTCLFPENKRWRNMKFSTRCLWKWCASWCVQRVHITSEPPQSQLFCNQDKWLIFSWCYPKWFERFSILSPKKNNKQSPIFIWIELEGDEILCSS